MPYANIITSAKLTDSKKSDLLKAVSRIFTDIMGKPQKYVLVTIQDASAMMAGIEGPAAFIDLRAIGGITGKTNSALSDKLCTAITSIAGIPGDRIYINFTDVPAENWGCNGSTFG